MIMSLLLSLSAAHAVPCEHPSSTIGDATELIGAWNTSWFPDDNLVMVPAGGTAVRDELVVILPGLDVDPTQLTNLIEASARAGFITIALAWDNDQVTYQECQASSATDAAVDGCVSSERLTRHRGNIITSGVEEELLGALGELDAAYPGKNIGRFMGGSGVEWSKVVMAGYSEGAGQAAWTAVNYPLKGAFLISGGGDFGVLTDPTPGNEQTSDLASWMLDPLATPVDNIVALYHQAELGESAINFGLDTFGVAATVRDPVPQTATWAGWNEKRLETTISNLCGPHSISTAGTNFVGVDCAEYDPVTGDYSLSQAHFYGVCRAAR